MKTEYVERWAEKLDSGEYKQTGGALNRIVPDHVNQPGYCCLGVLCEVLVEDGILRKYQPLSVTEVMSYGPANDPLDGGSSAFVPESARDALEIKKTDFWFDVTDIKDELNDDSEAARTKDGRWVAPAVGLNDSKSLTFPQIAQLLRNGKLWEYDNEAFED